jgi:hypothetical protein
VSAIAFVTGCLASVPAGAALATAWPWLEEGLSARVRHGVASGSFWFVASLPFTAPLLTGIFSDQVFLAWSGTAGRVLPDALPAQHWMVDAACLVAVAMATWALLGGLRLLMRIRKLTAVATAGAVRGGQPELPSILADVPGPMLIGYRAPVIVLPRSAVAHPAAVMDALKRHEEAHAKRGDNWRLLAEHVVLAAMPWCAPLRALHDDTLAAREELCDAWALRGADKATRAAYARALVHTIRTHSMPGTVVSTMAGPLPAVRRRLFAILEEHASKPRVPWRRRLVALGIASMGVAVAIVVCGAGNGLETMAGLHGVALRFVPLGDGTSGQYHVSRWGGPVDARHDMAPGDYKVTFARDTSGRWLVTTVPTAGKVR